MARYDDIHFELATNLLRSPVTVRRLRERWAGNENTPDVWDVKSLKLIDDRAAQQLKSIACGGNDGLAFTCIGEGDATTYITQPSTYRPYQSSLIEQNNPGAALYAHAMRLIQSDCVNEAVMASPLAAISVLAAATVHKSARAQDARLDRLFTGLDKITKKVPKKGGDLLRLVQAYCNQFSRSAPCDCPSMVVRNFFSSAYAWTCIRGTDARMFDLCAAMLVITIEVDFVGTADDGGVEADVYKMAASDGLTCLGGSSSQRTLQDTIVACAFMNAKKNIMRAVDCISSPGKLIGQMGGAITPYELCLARSWDGVILPWYRVMMNSAPYRHLMDDHGALRAMKKCSHIERALYGIIRYNEMADFIFDYANNESLNECLLGLVLGGESAVLGYGAAVASLIDEALLCECNQVGHEEVAEFAMGYCLWMLLVPRYQIFKQLLALRRSDDDVSHAYADLPAKCRLKSVLKTLAPGTMLHTSNWIPLWRDSDLVGDNRGADLIDELKRRIVRRSLLRDVYVSVNHEVCDKLARFLLVECGKHDDALMLSALAVHWEKLFDACLDVSGVDVGAHQELIKCLRRLLRQLWKNIVTLDEEIAENTDCFFLDNDSVVRRTYALPSASGLVLRRAFFGVATSAVELCGFSPYSRLTDAVAVMCSAEQHSH